MHNVALVSITENIDYSTPEGMLMTQLLGSFAQFFSNMLGTHVSKGLDERANEGRHTGGNPVRIRILLDEPGWRAQAQMPKRAFRGRSSYCVRGCRGPGDVQTVLDGIDHTKPARRVAERELLTDSQHQAAGRR